MRIIILVTCLLLIFFSFSIDTDSIGTLELPEEYKAMEPGDTMYLHRSGNDYELRFHTDCHWDQKIIIK